MKKQFGYCIFGVVMTLFVSNMVCAQESETEKRYLIAITTEIENVKVLAQKAASTADERERLQFDYEALLHDLNDMQTAIEQHVKSPSRSPRRVNALITHYSKSVNDE